MLAFSYHGQMCRQFLAALHFNENVNRDIKTSENGKVQVKVSFPKYKMNDDFSVRLLKKDQTYIYVQLLTEEALGICGEGAIVTAPAPLLSSNVLEAKANKGGGYPSPRMEMQITSILKK